MALAVWTGARVVTGIFTIPLSAHSPGSAREVAGDACRLGEFIAGPENLLAASALRPYLDRAATPYSPLVLYGPHGSGKSHLARGLADWWRDHFPHARVAVLSAAEFGQAYVTAVHDQRLEALRRKLQNVALFVLEDLGQLAGKRAAQEELVRLLDVLADREAMVVVTAQWLPIQTNVLMASLRSRLSAGLSVPLALPAPSTRRAILQRVVETRGIALPKRTLHCLADKLNVSVPALVAAVQELVQAHQQAADSDEVTQRLAEQAAARMPSLSEIGTLTAKYFGLKLADLKSPLRQRPLVAARAMAMYLSRQLTDKSLERIGEFFGRRDHTTVLHACRRTEKLLRRDRASRQAASELKRNLLAAS